MKTRGVQGMVEKTLNCKALEYGFSSLRAVNVQARDQISEPGSMPTSEMTTRKKPAKRHIHVSSSARVKMCLTSHKEALRSPYPRSFNSHSCLSQLGPPYTPQPPISGLIQRVLSSDSLSQLGPTKAIQHKISPCLSIHTRCGAPNPRETKSFEDRSLLTWARGEFSSSPP